MAVYKTKNADAALSAVEFTPVSDGNFSFFTAKNPEQIKRLRELVTSPELGQTISGESIVGKRRILITHGHKSKEELIKALEAKGTELELRQEHTPTDPWRIISMLAVPGQLLQLASSVMRKNGKLDWGSFIFASSNLAGHAITWTYGAQKSEDTNRLDYVKTKLNNRLSDFVAEGDELPSIHDLRKAQYMDETKPGTTEKVDRFLQRNSVYVGEIFCRYLGTVALAFPPDKWNKALQSGSFSEAYKSAKNPYTLTHYAGLASLAGKTTSLMAKVEDPYDTKPKSAFDSFREKAAFRTASWIEAGAFATMTYDSLTNPQRRIRLRGKESPDYVGALGSALFTTRYIVRNWAKFGEKNIDMDEVFAHATDCLAKMPPDQLPKLVADTAADLTSHFKDKQLDYGQVYMRLMVDLYRNHHIALDTQGAEPTEQTTKAYMSFVESMHKDKKPAQSLRPGLKNYAATVKSPKAEPLMERGS